MGSERLPRKLAGILYADGAGYSRLTGANEECTHLRVVHHAGEAALADFGTITDAGHARSSRCLRLTAQA